MPRKKLDCYQVFRVEEVKKDDPVSVRLEEMHFDQLRTVEAPDGYFTRYLSTMILPKRKRGVKFRVTYSQVFQKDL